MAKGIYVEIDNLEPLLQWLKTKPTGQINVKVGGTSDCVPAVLNYLGSDYPLAKWIHEKAAAGEIDIKSIPEGASLPIGVILEE